MKKTLSALLAVALLSIVALGTLTSCSLLFGSKYEFVDLGDSYEFAGLGESTDSEIVVPSKYKGKPVTSIGKQAFYRSIWDQFNSDVEYPTITSITLPDTITKIDDEAFVECTGITSLTIPSSVTSIGSGAFYNCTKLVSVNIPDGITTIEDGTFSGCYALSSITIPESVTTIGTSAFQNCAALTSITLPSKVTEISAYCFSNCNSLTSFTIPSQITAIGNNAFEKCTSLTALTINDTVKTLGDYVFSETGKDLVVSVCYDAEPQEGWAEKWHYNMLGKAINTSEVYYENVVVPNKEKAEALQKQIDELLEEYNHIQKVELPALAQARNRAQESGSNSAYKAAQQAFRAKEEERNNIAKLRTEKVEELKKTPTTNQINISVEADD